MSNKQDTLIVLLMTTIGIISLLVFITIEPSNVLLGITAITSFIGLNILLFNPFNP
jgi:hypothetical protein